MNWEELQILLIAEAAFFLSVLVQLVLHEAGHFVAIATGRSYAMAVDYMRDMGFSNMVSDG